MLRAIFYVFSVALLGLSIFIVAAPSKYFIVDLMANMTLQYLFFTLVFLVLALLLKIYRSTVVLLAATAFFALKIHASYVKPFEDKKKDFHQSAPQEKLPLKIFQMNARASNTKGAREFTSYVEESDFDVIVVFEMNNYWQMALASLKKTYPYHFFHAKGMKYAHFGLVTKIKFNTVSTVETQTGMPIFHLNMDLGPRNYNLYFLHPRSPVFSISFDKRNAYMEAFLKYYKARENTVVLGDMNNTLYSSYLRDFLEQTELFPVNSSSVFLSTWPDVLPILGLGIDQIFVSKGIQYQNIRRGPSFYSDHRSLETTLLIAN